MSIEVNGKKVDWVQNESIKELLRRVKYTFPLVIVKINDKVIARSEYLTVKIPNNSNIL